MNRAWRLSRISARGACLAAAACLAAGRLWAGASLPFTEESGLRLSSSAVQSAVSVTASDCGGSATACERIYYIAQSTSTGMTQVLSALTSDELTLNPESGVRLSTATTPALDIQVSSITGCSVLALSGGGYRMLYSVLGSTGSYRVYSATSADGVAWANDPGTPVLNPGGVVASPSVVKLTAGNLSGDWTAYYVGNQGSGNEIYEAYSSNQGVSWNTPFLALSAAATQVSAAVLTSGSVRLVYTAPLSGSTTATQVLSALSSDSSGASFSAESGALVSTAAADGSLGYPFLLRDLSQTYRWRLYYDFIPLGAATGTVLSALTQSPVPQSMSPSSIYYTQAGSTFTISGEVFSPALNSVELTMSGQSSIIGSGVSVTNDNTISVFFNTQNAATGDWSLQVTNSDGTSGVLSGALSITVPPGSVSLTDNLIRPLEGGKTSVKVTIYAAGPVSLRIYDLRGRLVDDLLEASEPIGTFTEYWDGVTSDGRTVASGVYVLRSLGPNLKSIDKIVVIK